MTIFICFKICYGLVLIITILLSVAFVTLFERKVMGFMQRRRGPNVVGIYGLLQPLADGIKLILKETILPLKSNSIVFFCAPVITFWLSLMGWIVIPFSDNVVYSNITLSIIYIFAISSISVYGIVFGGWGSNSKYPLLGALRSAAQMISYEVSFGLIVMSVLLFTDSVNLILIVENQKSCWNIFPLFFAFCLFFISILAETNRPPFDLPEAEAELVSGYNVEYSALTFALFFLGEYSSIIIMSAYCVLLYLGGYLTMILIYTWKILFIIFCFVWVRAAYPRLRYDQLMNMGWKVLLPLIGGYIILLHGNIDFFSILLNEFIMTYIFPKIGYYGVSIIILMWIKFNLLLFYIIAVIKFNGSFLTLIGFGSAGISKGISNLEQQPDDAQDPDEDPDHEPDADIIKRMQASNALDCVGSILCLYFIVHLDIEPTVFLLLGSVLSFDKDETEPKYDFFVELIGIVVCCYIVCHFYSGINIYALLLGSVVTLEEPYDYTGTKESCVTKTKKNKQCLI